LRTTFITINGEIYRGNRFLFTANPPAALRPGLPKNSPLNAGLAALVTENLDCELEQQGADGAWSPNWNWQGHLPAEWQIARREWQGELTLRMLRSFRAFGRLERG